MTEIDRYGHAVERVHPDRPEPPRPLTPDEITAIIDLVVAYTRREPDATMVQVWATQSMIGRWTYEEAAAAIHLWGANRANNDFLEPGVITQAIRTERRHRALREEQARLEATPGDPATADRIRQICDDLAQTMGWTDEGHTRQGFALSVPCPHCHADIGERCVSVSTGKPLRETPCHPARTEKLAEHIRDAS